MQKNNSGSFCVTGNVYVCVDALFAQGDRNCLAFYAPGVLCATLLRGDEAQRPTPGIQAAVIAALLSRAAK